MASLSRVMAVVPNPCGKNDTPHHTTPHIDSDTRHRSYKMACAHPLALRSVVSRGVDDRKPKKDGYPYLPTFQGTCARVGQAHYGAYAFVCSQRLLKIVDESCLAVSHFFGVISNNNIQSLIFHILFSLLSRAAPGFPTSPRSGFVTGKMDFMDVEAKDFEVISTLGRGTYGLVVKARNKLIGKEYALKVAPLCAESQAQGSLLLARGSQCKL